MVDEVTEDVVDEVMPEEPSSDDVASVLDEELSSVLSELSKLLSNELKIS